MERMLMVRIVGTVRKISLVYEWAAKKTTRTHHQALDILHPRLLDGLAPQNHANTGPSEEQAAEPDRDEPVERRKVE